MFKRIKKFFSDPLEPLNIENIYSSATDSCTVDIFNDNKTSMDFVVNVLRTYFLLSKEKSVEVMLEIHTNGKGSIVGIDPNAVEPLLSKIAEESKKRGFNLNCKVNGA